MTEWLAELVGEEYANWALIAIIALAALIVLFVVSRIVRFMRSGTYVTGGRNRQIRLAVIDATPVDEHRRLVLVRRDDVEHLILIGGPTDVVVESGIGAERSPMSARLPATPSAPATERPRRAEPVAPVAESPAAPRPEPPVEPARARLETPQATTPPVQTAPAVRVQVAPAREAQPDAAVRRPVAQLAQPAAAVREATMPATETREQAPLARRVEPTMRDYPPQADARALPASAPRPQVHSAMQARPARDSAPTTPLDNDPFGDSIADIENALNAAVSPVQPVASARPAITTPANQIQPPRRFENLQRPTERRSDTLESEMEQLLNSLTPRDPKSGS